MRRILAVRKPEFAVAVLTTAAVVLLGVEYGIALAVVAADGFSGRHSAYLRSLSAGAMLR